MAPEWTIAEVHAAFAAGRLTCAQLVQSCLDRIEAYDRRGPALNAILAVNPKALAEAAAKDRGFDPADLAARPLLGIPVVLKDNYDTADMATTGGAVTLARSVPPADAFVVRRLREAGAVIVAKANLTELAWHGTTVSSLGGQTRNPYDLTRTPGGSSGGTGAAIAAGFGVVGMGTDTQQSIRSPASANSLVGLRPTRGLVSRGGIIPVSMTQDECGPITRTVADAARVLDVIAGYDPADPVTASGRGRRPGSYAAGLAEGSLGGARIGVLMDFFGEEAIHEDVNEVVEEAIQRMEDAGATLVRMSIPDLAELTRDTSLVAFEFKAALDGYLGSLGPDAPVRTLSELMARREFHGSLRAGLEEALKVTDGLNDPEYWDRQVKRQELAKAVTAALAGDALDAILYPHQRRLVVPIGGEQVERNGVLASGTGLPAVCFPGGFSAPTASAPLGVPVGVELLGPAWSEHPLLKLAHAFEQIAGARRPPASTPPLA